MWLKCQRCERTVLELSNQASLPYLCNRCKEEDPNYIVFVPLNALPSGVDQFVDEYRRLTNQAYTAMGMAPPYEIVIDVTPKKADDAASL